MPPDSCSWYCLLILTLCGAVWLLVWKNAPVNFPKGFASNATLTLTCHTYTYVFALDENNRGEIKALSMNCFQFSPGIKQIYTCKRFCMRSTSNVVFLMMGLCTHIYNWNIRTNTNTHTHKMFTHILPVWPSTVFQTYENKSNKKICMYCRWKS